MMSQQEQLKDIVAPHAHDVLSGRGNFVNHHAGNENFRALVKRHKKEYVACPKAQKPMYSILIYDEIRSMSPPGRFLKQDPKTKLWSDIGKKKALDKTRQALREGAPEMLKELGGGEDDDDEEPTGPATQTRKMRDENPLNASFMSNISIGSFSIEGMNEAHSAIPESIQSVINQGQGNIPGAIGGCGNMQSDQGSDPNRLLMAAQMQLIEQQMAQWQQLVNMQNLLQNSGNQLDPSTQLQLLNLQLQLQNQKQQSQQQGMVSGNDLGNQHQNMLNSTLGHPGGNNSISSSPQMGNMHQGQLSDQNIAALLSAIHNNAANQNNAFRNQNAPAAGPTISNSAFQQLQQQMAMQQLNQMINNSNSNQAANSPNMNNNQWGGGNSSTFDNILNAANAIHGSNTQTGQFGDFTVALNDGSNQDQIIGMTMPLQNNERKPGATSFARSQRIGLKNSFTRRPNSHWQNPLTNSLMSLESLNIDDVDEMNDAE